MSAPVIKCRKTPVKKCRKMAEVKKKWRKRLRRCKKPIRARGEARQMRTETMAKEKAAATANSNRQSKRLPLSRSQFQYTIGNAAFQAKHKNGPVRRLSLKTDYPHNFLNILKRDSGEFKRIAAAGRPGGTKSRVATGYSLALCLVLISMST